MSSFPSALQYLCCCTPCTTPSVAGCTFCHGMTETLCCLPISGYNMLNCGEKEVYVVTGGNRGVGYHSVKILLQRGHTVYLLSRNLKRGEDAVQSLIKLTGNESCECFQMDLDDLNSIHKFLTVLTERKVAIKGLINNGGIISENAVKTNHIGHFALTLGLLPFMRKAVSMYGQAYIVNVSSVAHWDGALDLPKYIEALGSGTDYKRGSWPAYTASKAANALFSLALARALGPGVDNAQLVTGSFDHALNKMEQGFGSLNDDESKDPAVQNGIMKGVAANSGVSVYSYHPGVMMTDLWNSSAHGNASEKSDGMNACVQWAMCCCVKHPAISAVGLTSLVNPRSCYQLRASCCLRDPVASPPVGDGADSASGSSKYVNRSECLCFEGSGGYYQQCFCCCVVPVRFNYLLYSPSTGSQGDMTMKRNAIADTNSPTTVDKECCTQKSSSLEDCLMENSFSYVKQHHKELYHMILHSYYTEPVLSAEEAQAARRRQCFKKPSGVYPGYMCTECISAAPYCACCAVMC